MFVIRRVRQPFVRLSFDVVSFIIILYSFSQAIKETLPLIFFKFTFNDKL